MEFWRGTTPLRQRQRVVTICAYHMGAMTIYRNFNGGIGKRVRTIERFQLKISRMGFWRSTLLTFTQDAAEHLRHSSQALDDLLGREAAGSHLRACPAP